MSSPGAGSISARAEKIHGFPPVVGCEPRILILGSMPGVASLNAGQYYAMPRNAFWPIMGDLFGAHFELAYDDRLEVLKRNRVALWDVLASCVRPGSLDSAIDGRTAAVNDFAGLLAAQPTIGRIFFNGRKSAELYRRRVLPTLDLERAKPATLALPSTSPAHAALSFADKLAAWTVVRDAVLGA